MLIAGASLVISGMPTTLSLSFVLMGICFTVNVTIYQTWFQHATHAICTSIAVAPEDYRRIIGDGRREFLVSGKGKALVRMGLVEMKSDPVVFWFEKYQEGATA